MQTSAASRRPAAASLLNRILVPGEDDLYTPLYELDAALDGDQSQSRKSGNKMFPIPRIG